MVCNTKRLLLQLYGFVSTWDGLWFQACWQDLWLEEWDIARDQCGSPNYTITLSRNTFSPTVHTLPHTTSEKDMLLWDLMVKSGMTETWLSDKKMPTSTWQSSYNKSSWYMSNKVCESRCRDLLLWTAAMSFHSLLFFCLSRSAATTGGGHIHFHSCGGAGCKAVISDCACERGGVGWFQLSVWAEGVVHMA